MAHPALNQDSVAVITGGGAGIGLAIAHRFAAHGMAVAIADVREDALEEASVALKSSGAREVLAQRTDVSNRQSIAELEKQVSSRFGGTDILVNNAGIQPGSAMFGPPEVWEKVIGVNLWGIINSTQLFVPGMIARGRPGAVINTGSKQGITTPPGDPAYNVSKSGVKAFTEALAHELRNTPGAQLSAHLLIPGFVFTDLTRRDRTEKPAGAWTPDQTADFMIERLNAGDSYILCPDNDVSRELDEKRMAWAIGDIIENRPALSRWHPDYAAAFEAFVNRD